MADDLRYKIGADTTGVDAAWAKLRREARQGGIAMSTALGRVRMDAQALLAPLRTLPSLFAAIGATALLSSMRQTAEAVADIGRQAKQTGLDIESFQELKFVAEQNRIGVDVLTDGMKELNLRADEFVATGKGPAAEAFGRLGYSSEELARKLKNPSALLTEIIGKLEDFDQAARIRISDELFGGTAGERLVELVDQGERGIRDQIQAARELGLILDADVIQKAEEVDRKFQVIATTIGTNVKEAIVNATSAWFDFLESFRKFENQHTGALERSARENDRERLDLENRILMLREQQAKQSGADADYQRRRIQEQIDLLRERDAELGQKGRLIENALQSRRPPPADSSSDPQKTIDTSADFIRKYREELALSNRERAIAAEQQRILNSASSEGAKLTEEQARALAEEAIKRKEAESATKASTTATEKDAKAIEKVIAQLDHELSLIGQTATQKRILNELRKAGVAATSEEGQAIAAKVRQLESERSAEENLKDAQEARLEAIDDLFQMGGNALVSLAENSDDAEKSLKRLVAQLGLAAAQAALLGTGPLAGLFGGGFLGGGPVSPGASSAIASGAIGLFDRGGYTGDGSRRDVAGVVHRKEFVTNADATAKYRPILEAMNAGRDVGMYNLGATMAQMGARTSGRTQIDVGVYVEDAGKLGAIAREAGREGGSEAAEVRVTTFSDRELPDRLQQIKRAPRLR